MASQWTTPSRGSRPPREELDKLAADQGGRLTLEKGDDPKDLSALAGREREFVADLTGLVTMIDGLAPKPS